MSYQTDLERRAAFMRHTSVAPWGSCVLWRGRMSKRHRGYGLYWSHYSKQDTYVQRAAYELYVSRERLPRGTKVYAKCGNRLCVNHKHLFLSYSPFKSVEALAAGGRLR